MKPSLTHGAVSAAESAVQQLEELPGAPIQAHAGLRLQPLPSAVPGLTRPDPAPAPCRRLKILFINRSYTRDGEATGQLLFELSQYLSRFHDVTIIAGRENVDDLSLKDFVLFREDGAPPLRVIRVHNIRFTKLSLFRRAIGLASYLLLALWAGFFVAKPDIIVAETDPPFLGTLGALLSWRHGSRFIFYLQDLFPDVGVEIRRFRPGFLTWLMEKTTRIGLEAADHVIVLAEDMKRRVTGKGILPEKVGVVHNWANTDLLGPRHHGDTMRAAWGLTGKFVVMYSGNVGLSQKLDLLPEVALRLAESSEIAFVVIGGGAFLGTLKDRVTSLHLQNVKFLQYQPKTHLAESLCTADVHLLSLHPGLCGCMVPCKLYGILACGLPYIAAVDRESEVARVTRLYGSGVLVEPDSVSELVSSILWCRDNPAQLAAMGRRGRAAAVTEFDQAAALSRFADVIRNLTSPPKKQPYEARSLSCNASE